MTKSNKKSAPRCPRCGHYIPNDDEPGAYPGALSRVDNRTDVCSPCGLAEAFEQNATAGASLSKDAWAN